MADADVVDFETRIEIVLRDTTNLVFSLTQEDEALRQALDEYNLTLGGTAKIIEGLAGAASATTLPAAHRSLLVLAAAGFAVLSRAEERSEAYSLEQAVPATMKSWADNRLAGFRRQLEQIRVRGLLAGAHPWDADHPWGDDE